ncbi:hypothetical protein [Clostridium sp. 3-3]|uniref:hypothetical protein n=1 Tax=Clostridium sp. 3-3 TaxID=2070757 RepID=UPI00325B46E7
MVFHRPLLLNFLNEKYYLYQERVIGTSSFRTISVFGHPIVCGLFFVIAFIINLYLLKGYKKYIFEIILVINIYSTRSRSSWLTLLLIIILLAVNKIKESKLKFHKKLSLKRIIGFGLTFCTSVVVIRMFVVNYTIILNIIMTRFGNSLSFTSTDISNLQRIGAIKIIISDLYHGGPIHLFFGNGIASASEFMKLNKVVLENFGNVDNMFITWIYEFGFVGFGFIISLIILLISNGIKNNSVITYKICLYALLAILLESFFFESISYWYPMTVTIGFIISTLSFGYSKKAAFEQT